MSHFSVLVIGDDVEAALAPFQENNMGDCPKAYLAFNDIEDEHRQEYETESVEMVRLPNGELVLPWDERFRVPGTIGTGGGTHKAPPELARVQVPFKEKYESFEVFMFDWCGHQKRDPEKHRYGSWENQHRKWDWWEVGGRFSKTLKLKPGGTGVFMECGEGFGAPRMLRETTEGFVDQARLKCIDWEGMRQRRLAEHAQWYSEFERKKLEGEDVRFLRYSYDIKEGQTREEYIRGAERFSVFAVAKDGKWFERGKMGWWACVSNEKDPVKWAKELEAMLSDLPPDSLLTIVDCHI